MSGLLAARVLTDCFPRVTLVERDDLRQVVEHRRGLPQGRHTHGLLARGREVLEELFPGLSQELLRQGGVLADLQDDCRWHNDGHLLRQSHSGLHGIALSRPMLERAVRARVLALANVTLLAPCDVDELQHRAGEVTGVRVRPRDGGPTQDLHADLVIDATGRGSRTPTWLESVGYPGPEVETIELSLGYVTRQFAWCPGDLYDDAAVVVGPTQQNPRFGVALRQEGQRWTVTIGGYGSDRAPADLDGFKTFANSLPSAEIGQLIADKGPLSEPLTYRFQSSQRRRYDRLRRFPNGLVVTGDAICSFNPIYGQGMSVAAIEALALRDVLASGDQDIGRRFFRRAVRAAQGPWDIAAGGDLRLPVVPGPRPLKVRIVNAYVAQVQAAAAADEVVGRALLDVANLLRGPESLLRPQIARRVLLGTRPGRAAAPSVPAPRGPHADERAAEAREEMQGQRSAPDGA
jgi:2-polyprenyl-6-methoxyphenol hydroxylase-like FAD-dependent oxidoreductase